MSIKGAKGVLLNISGGINLGLHEISEAASIIYEQADEDANIILGSVIDEAITDEISVTIIATGFEVQEKKSQEHMLKIKPTVVDTEVTMSAEVTLEDPVVTVKKEATEEIQKAPELHVAQDVPVDMQDLDVPTFLRKQQGNQAQE